MIAKELKEKIAGGETSALQFKLTWTNNDSIAAEMAAFANGKGGTIVFGVEDKNGTIEGLSYDDIQDLSRRVANIANENILPTLYVYTETVDLDGKQLLLAHIPRGMSKPYKTLKGEIWVKQGSDKRRVKENSEILRMFQESGQYQADREMLVNAKIEDWDERSIDAYFMKFFHRTKESFGVPLEKLYCNIGITNEEGQVTLAGELFFGKHPEWALPQFVIKAVAFVGNDLGGTQYRDSRDLEGTLPELYDKAMAFCENNLHHVQAGQSFNSIGKLEVSRIALEELIQNSLVHRQYLINAPIRLLIFDNRIEIVSPGCLPNNLTVDQIKLGSSYPRNPLIANLCSKTMVYRGLGSGIVRATGDNARIDLINDEERDLFTAIIYRDKNKVQMKDADIDHSPNKVQLCEFKVQKTGFKVQIDLKKLATLQNKVQDLLKKANLVTDRKLALLTDLTILVSAQPNVTQQELVSQMGMSLRSIKEYQDILQKANILQREGSKKTGTWKINEDIM